MKRNRSFEPDTPSKICDKTACLWFPHLATAGSPGPGTVAERITRSESHARFCVRASEAQMGRDSACRLWFQGREQGC